MTFRSPTARGALATLILAGGLLSCGAPPSPDAPAARALPSASAATQVAAPAAPVDPPMPALRTGSLAPVEARGVIEGRVVARHLGDVVETLAIEVRVPADVEGAPWGAATAVVAVDGAGPAPYSFLGADARSPGSDGGLRTLWIRRPRKASGTAVGGRLFGAHRGGEAGVVARFQAPAAPAIAKSDPATLTAFARALEQSIGREGGPFGAFAADRLRRIHPPTPEAARRAPGRAAPRLTPTRAQGDLGRLMETTTGVASIQEALQSDRPLLAAATREKPSVPVTSLALPKSAPHPWDELLATAPAIAPKEALAAVTPAEFWFVRAKDLGVVFKLTDELDRWATPAADAIDGRAEDRGLSARYEAELGLGRSAIARAFGPEVVGEVAIVGSDPYLREGSDVTAIFQLKSRAAFEAALAAALADHGARHGGITATTVRVADVDVRVATSADGAVRQHRVTLEDLAFVSNSQGALRRVIEAAKGKRARLADEKDFRYLLARDASVRADALGFLGDRFVAEVVGPRQKILEARRQLAVAELETPTLAALLHGWLFGASPASLDDLVKSGLLGKDELVHGRGGAISWKPGEAPRSAFGTPAALTPLVDQPAPELVTPSERDAYARFAASYESYWSQYIDPAALRVAIDGEGDGARLTADLRVMPLIEGTEYRRLADLVGSTRLEVPPARVGARMTLALGVSARLRRELSSGARRFGGRRDLDLDWIGDYALIGTLDRTPVAKAVHELAQGDLPERPLTDDEGDARRERDVIAEAARAPVYAAIGVRSPAAAALAIAAARAVADDALPGMLSWGELGKHRDVSIVRVAFREGRRHRDGDGSAPDDAPDVTVYYALANGALVIALDEQAIRLVIDDLVEGRAPKPVARAAQGGAQHVLDLTLDKQGAISTVIGWLLEGEVQSAGGRSRAAAEVILRGAPELRDAASVRAIGLAYLGAAPLTPDGGSYAIGPDGVRDPARGTAHAPTWPALPVPGSPVAKLLGAVRSFRSELSVDREGAARRDAMQSLHARITIGLAGP